MQKKELLRLTTAGSVDDGKSTLIGRLLLDSGSLYEDQIKSIEKIYLGKEANGIDLALFTDGLKEEREMGITIDVAYRYFETPICKFILADSPGHLEYTKNMVTAASTADAVILLVDAQTGITEQTRRHTYLTSLLNINSLIICVNKMDLVGWDENTYSKIVSDIQEFMLEMNFNELVFIPISGLNGDNVVNPSTTVKWYKGMPLLKTLENIRVSNYLKNVSRFPVQLSLDNKGKDGKNEKVFAGQITQGLFRVNDEIEVLPSGLTSQIKSIHVGEKKLEEASSGMSITMELVDDLQIQRGDLIMKPSDKAEMARNIDVKLCWLGLKPAKVGTKYIILHATTEGFARIETISDQVDMNSFTALDENSETGINAIVNARIQTDAPLVFDSYSTNRTMGSFILVDCTSNETVAAGIIK